MDVTQSPKSPEYDQHFLNACENGDVGAAKMMLERGAEAEARNTVEETAVHLAVKSGNVLMLNYLIKECNADVDVRDSFGRTPLHWAAQKGNVDMVESLLLAGADVNAKDSRDIAVRIYAELEGHRELVKLFTMINNARR